MVNLTDAAISDASAENSCPLACPPAINMIFLLSLLPSPLMAAMVAPTLVAFESLIKLTELTSAIVWQR